MESTKKSNEYEPTLSNVLGAVQTGFMKMEERFDEVGERFNNVESRISTVERRAGTIEITLEEMKETLKGVERAVDKDAVTVVNHGRRIVRLEKVCAVPA